MGNQKSSQEKSSQEGTSQPEKKSSQEGTSQPNDLGLSLIFDYEELQEATKFFNPSQVIGEGGYGVVYRGQLKDGRAVAIKELTFRHKKRMDQFFNEARLISRLHHKNLVTLYGCTNPKDGKMFLVYDFVPNGTLADHLRRRRFSRKALTWRQRLQIAINTAESLSYMHSREPPIIHRDIKSENILLDNDFNAIVADFGLCRLLPSFQDYVSTMPQGTQGYLDPEYNLLCKLTTKSDVYSFGVVMMELISGRAVFDLERSGDEIWLVRMAFNKKKNDHLEQLVDLQLEYQDDSEVFHMINSVAELAFECLQPTGDRRPPMIDVLKSLEAIRDYRYPLYWSKVHDYNTAQLTVCVTAADGFIGSWLVKLLLLRGYTVKGTVRNPDDAKNSHLRALDGAAERLILCKADLFDYDALRRAFDDCVGVFYSIHSACEDGKLMRESTWHVIVAAAKAGVRRVVYTSSIAAMMCNPSLVAVLENFSINLGTYPGAVVDESCWSDPDTCLKKEFQVGYDTVLAEREAWDTAGNRGIDLVVVCLTHLIIGPQLLPGNQDCSNVKILAFLDGSAGFDTTDWDGAPYVHMMDVAEAHVRVFEAPEAKGRYFCFGNVLSYADDVPILAKLFPEHPLTDRSDKVILKEWPFKFSNQKLRDLGLKFTPTTQCIYDIVKSLQKTEHLPIINTT